MKDAKTFPGQTDPADDPINYPKHYTSHPSGVEQIEITEHMSFCLGNAIKYIWRAGLKDATAEGEVEDLRKAVWYLNREIARLGKIPLPQVDSHVQIRVSGVSYPVDVEDLSD